MYSRNFLGGRPSYDNDSGKRNTIGLYGCKFMAVASIANAIKLNHFGWSLFSEDMVDLFNKSGYFSYASNNTGGEDVNLGDEGAKRLISDIARVEVKLTRYTTNLTERLKELAADNNDNYVYVRFKDAKGNDHYGALNMGIDVNPRTGEVTLLYDEQAESWSGESGRRRGKYLVEIGVFTIQRMDDN
jgi:hypothetical protein